MLPQCCTGCKTRCEPERMLIAAACYAQARLTGLCDSQGIYFPATQSGWRDYFRRNAAAGQEPWVFGSAFISEAMETAVAAIVRRLLHEAGVACRASRIPPGSGRPVPDEPGEGDVAPFIVRMLDLQR